MNTTSQNPTKCMAPLPLEMKSTMQKDQYKNFLFKMKVAKQIKEFLGLGFKGRMAFVQVVCSYCPSYPIMNLVDYWDFNLIDESVYEMVQSALEKLKSE